MELVSYITNMKSITFQEQCFDMSHRHYSDNSTKASSRDTVPTVGVSPKICQPQVNTATQTTQTANAYQTTVHTNHRP